MRRVVLTLLPTIHLRSADPNNRQDRLQHQKELIRCAFLCRIIFIIFTFNILKLSIFLLYSCSICSNVLLFFNYFGIWNFFFSFLIEGATCSYVNTIVSVFIRRGHVFIYEHTTLSNQAMCSYTYACSKLRGMWVSILKKITGQCFGSPLDQSSTKKSLGPIGNNTGFQVGGQSARLMFFSHFPGKFWAICRQQIW